MHYRLQSLTVNGRPVDLALLAPAVRLASVRSMLSSAPAEARLVKIRGRSIKAGSIIVTLSDPPRTKPSRRRSAKARPRRRV